MDKAAQGICNALDGLGAKVTVLTTDLGVNHQSGGDPHDEQESRGVAVHRSQIAVSSLGKRMGLYLSPSFPKMCRDFLPDADIVHFHGARSFQNATAAVFASKFQKRYVIQPHGSMATNDKRKTLKHIYDSCFGNPQFQRCGGMIAATELEADTLKRLGIPHSRIHLVPNGVDRDFWSRSVPNPFDLREMFRIRREAPLILFVGRLDATKGLGMLVHAFALLHQEFPDSVLVIAGPDFGERAPIIRLCHTLRLQHSVVLTGQLTKLQVLAAYKTATVTVLPSTFESFGLAALESAAAGCPVAVARTCGVASMIRSAGGIIFEPNAQSMYQSLASLIRNPSALDSQLAALKRLPWNELSWVAIGRRLIEVYSTVLNEPMPGGRV